MGGRPPAGRVDGASAPACPTWQGALRGSLRDGRRAARVLSPCRRPRTPHRNVDVSGVLFAGLAFGKAMVLSDIGAFANWWRRRALGGWWPRTIQKRSARRSPSCSPTRPPARRSRARRGGGRRQPLLGPHRRAHAPGLPRGAGVRAVYLAKSKRSAARALDWLAGQGCDVAAVVTSEPDRWTRDEQRVDLVARRHGLPLVSEAELYANPPADIDVVISFLYWRLIREPLISLGRVGCLNFHPPPCPTSAAWAVTTWPSWRVSPSGACPRISWTRVSTPATWWRSSAFLRQRHGHGVLPRSDEPGAPARSLQADPGARNGRRGAAAPPAARGAT